MAKHVCNHCGAEVGLLQQIKMRDGNYICRKCAGKTHPLFVPANEKTFSMFQEHLKQLETGKVLYEKLFVPRKKSADKAMQLDRLSAGIEVAKDIGLLAVVRKRGGFFIWGGTPYYMVFRLGDLFRYEYSSERSKSADGKTQVKHYIQFAFWDTPGCDEFRVNITNERTYTLAAKYFNQCFGIQRDVRSVGDMFRGVKTLMSKDADNKAKEGAVEELTQTAKIQLYGDRTEWIAKANAAIQSITG